MKKKLKIARIATVPLFLDALLRQQLIHLLEKDYQVFAISSAQGDWSRLKAVKNLNCIELNIARTPSIIDDIKSLIKLIQLFKREQFDIIHSTTPKAGLLCAIAAKFSGIPIRLHTFTGQPWATKRGFARWLLRSFDKVIVLLNSQCYADSKSQRAYLINEGVGNQSSIQVLGEGSIAGVDLHRFNSCRWSLEDKNGIRSELGLTENNFVIAFVGRLAREKGIIELISAFKALRAKYNDLHLLLIGPVDEHEIQQYLSSWCVLPGVHYVGHTATPERYLAITNLLCLPSYREGFGTVVIEAAAMAIPTVGSKVTGLIDAIEDKKTGILVEAKDVESLQNSLEILITDLDFCKKLGDDAFQRCNLLYNSIKVNNLIVNEYENLVSHYSKKT